MKALDLIEVLGKISLDWREREGAGTDCVAVKCVDIVGNTKGVGMHLAFF